MKTPEPFLIVFIIPVVFRDVTGAVVQEYAVGDVVTASSQTQSYYVTTMGGIYFNEARPLDDEEPVTYAHVNSDDSTRFQQYAGDALPPWAVRVRLAE